MIRVPRMHAFPWHTAEFTLMRSFQFSIDSMVSRSEERFDAAQDRLLLRSRLLTAKRLHVCDDRFAIDAFVPGKSAKDCMKRFEPERMMVWDRDPVVSRLQGFQNDMT